MQGLANRHFDAIVGQFVGTLQDLGVQQVGACQRRAGHAAALGKVQAAGPSLQCQFQALQPVRNTTIRVCLCSTSLCRMLLTRRLPWWRAPGPSLIWLRTEGGLLRRKLFLALRSCQVVWETNVLCALHR